jgi:hypothetical protein
MASSINASTSGAGGVITTADNTGNLNLQSGGSTVLALTSSGVAITGTITASGTSFGNSTLKLVTDTTDITLPSISSSYATVGSSFSVSIPATGYINIASFAGRLTWSSVADNVSMNLGIRIGSTNYWFGKISENGSVGYSSIVTTQTSAGYTEYYGAPMRYASTGSGFATALAGLCIDISANSVPTGTQTVQLIASYGTVWTGIGILKGTTTTTRVGIQFVSAS